MRINELAAHPSRSIGILLVGCVILSFGQPSPASGNSQAGVHGEAHRKQTFRAKCLMGGSSYMASQRVIHLFEEEIVNSVLNGQPKDYGDVQQYAIERKSPPVIGLPSSEEEFCKCFGPVALTYSGTGGGAQHMNPQCHFGDGKGVLSWSIIYGGLPNSLGVMYTFSN